METTVVGADDLTEAVLAWAGPGEYVMLCADDWDRIRTAVSSAGMAAMFADIEMLPVHLPDNGHTVTNPADSVERMDLAVWLLREVSGANLNMAEENSVEWTTRDGATYVVSADTPGTVYISADGRIRSRDGDR